MPARSLRASRGTLCLADLDDDATTEAIDRAIAGVGDETAFTDAAAAALASTHDQA